MSPQLIQLIIFALEAAVQEAPALVADIQNIFASGNPTASDFAALRSKVASESYGQFVPDSQLPLPGSDATAQVTAQNGEAAIQGTSAESPAPALVESPAPAVAESPAYFKTRTVS